MFDQDQCQADTHQDGVDGLELVAQETEHQGCRKHRRPDLSRQLDRERSVVSGHLEEDSKRRHPAGRRGEAKMRRRLA